LVHHLLLNPLLLETTQRDLALFPKRAVSDHRGQDNKLERDLVLLQIRALVLLQESRQILHSEVALVLLKRQGQDHLRLENKELLRLDLDLALPPNRELHQQNRGLLHLEQEQQHERIQLQENRGLLHLEVALVVPPNRERLQESRQILHSEVVWVVLKKQAQDLQIIQPQGEFEIRQQERLQESRQILRLAVLGLVLLLKREQLQESKVLLHLEVALVVPPNRERLQESR